MNVCDVVTKEKQKKNRKKLTIMYSVFDIVNIEKKKRNRKYLTEQDIISILTENLPIGREFVDAATKNTFIIVGYNAFVMMIRKKDYVLNNLCYCDVFKATYLDVLEQLYETKKIMSDFTEVDFLKLKLLRKDFNNIEAKVEKNESVVFEILMCLGK